MLIIDSLDTKCEEGSNMFQYSVGYRDRYVLSGGHCVCYGLLSGQSSDVFIRTADWSYVILVYSLRF